jgi:hypothetical protein
MTTITITVNEKSAKGRKFVEFIKTLDYIKVNESPYKPDFVKEIQKSRASNGKVIKTEDLWK